MQRIYRMLGLLALLVVFSFPYITSASLTSGVAPVIPSAFGGTILTSIPCWSAPGFFAVNILERLSVPPFATINTYIVSMTSPFLSHITPHIGQNIVGNAIGVYSCIIDPNPKHFIQWVDPVSVFYGTSL